MQETCRSESKIICEILFEPNSFKAKLQRITKKMRFTLLQSWTLSTNNLFRNIRNMFYIIDVFITRRIHGFQRKEKKSWRYKINEHFVEKYLTTGNILISKQNTNV